jgi:hypothetical protein
MCIGLALTDILTSPCNRLLPTVRVGDYSLAPSAKTKTAEGSVACFARSFDVTEKGVFVHNRAITSTVPEVACHLRQGFFSKVAFTVIFPPALSVIVRSHKT